MKLFSKNIENHFFVKVANNKLTTEEAEFFNEWLEESDSNKEKYTDFIHLWEKLGEDEPPDTPDADEMWENIEDSINKETSIIFNEIKRDVNSYNFNSIQIKDSKYQKVGLWLVRIAAILLLFGLIHVFLRREPPRLIENTQISKSTSQTYIRSTKKGEKAVIPLADGSIVYLNADSKLTYPRYFDSITREVILEGEAYFVIEKNMQKPFRVAVENVVTEVVGTEFNIRNRKPGEIDVAVIKGKVRTFNSTIENVIIDIDRGQMVKFNKKSGFEKLSKIDISEILAWRQNKLAFNRTPLADVLQEIELNFDIRTKIINTNIIDKTLTGVFKTDSLNEIILALSISLDVNIVRKGNYLIVE